MVSRFKVIEAGTLLPNLSAQGTELVGLTRVAVLAQQKRVNIYTDSWYVFSVCHETRMLRKERGSRMGGK